MKVVFWWTAGKEYTKTQIHNNTKTFSFNFLEKGSNVADKTIGLKLEDWRQLKQIALDRDCTLSEAVAYLIEVAKSQGERNAGTSDSDTDKPADDSDR